MANGGLQITVSGIDKFKAELTQLSLNSSRGARIAAQALRAGGEVMQAAVKERAPVRTAPWSGRTKNLSWNLPPGALKSDIQLYVQQGKEGLQARAIIVPGKYTRSVARWVEYGHRVKRSKRQIKYSGAEGPGRPHPFIRPAFDEAQHAAFEATRTALLAEIAKVVDEMSILANRTFD